MAINPVRPGSIGAITIQSDGAQRKAGESGSSVARPQNREAMKVELSPAARSAAATSAVTNSNRQSASSSEWFASPQGREALSNLAPANPRSAVRL